MAKSASERKAAQRARQSAAGERKIELVLDSQELDMLDGTAPPAARVVRRMKWANILRC